MSNRSDSAQTFSLLDAAAWRDALHDAPILPLVFIPLTLLLFLPLPWMFFGWVLLPLYYAWRWRALGSPLPHTRANLFVLLLLLGVVIGLMTSPARLDGIEAAGKLLAGVTAFYVLLDVLKTERAMWRAASVMVALGLGLVLLLPFSVSWSADKIYTLPAFLDWTLRPPGQGTNPNIVGGMLVAVFPLAFALLFSHRRREQILGAVALGPIVVALFILQARGAWFALAGGLAVGAAFFRRWLVPLLPLLLLAVLFVNQQLGGASALSDVLYGKIGTATGGTLQERMEMWTQAVDLIRTHPLTGIGMGGYPYVAPVSPPHSPQDPGMVFPHTHNVFLQVALDTGIVGLVGFGGMFVLAFLSAWRAHTRRFAAPLPLALLTAFAVIVLHSLGESVFWNFKAQWMLWYLFGIAFALERASRAHSRASHTPHA